MHLIRMITLLITPLSSLFFPPSIVYLNSPKKNHCVMGGTIVICLFEKLRPLLPPSHYPKIISSLPPSLARTVRSIYAQLRKKYFNTHCVFLFFFFPVTRFLCRKIPNDATSQGQKYKAYSLKTIRVISISKNS